jgi:hypothetical protein
MQWKSSQNAVMQTQLNNMAAQTASKPLDTIKFDDKTRSSIDPVRNPG